MHEWKLQHEFLRCAVCTDWFSNTPCTVCRWLARYHAIDGGCCYAPGYFWVVQLTSCPGRPPL